MAPIISARIAVTGAVILICAAMITEYGCVTGAITQGGILATTADAWCMMMMFT